MEYGGLNSAVLCHSFRADTLCREILVVHEIRILLIDITVVYQPWSTENDAKIGVKRICCYQT